MSEIQVPEANPYSRRTVLQLAGLTVVSAALTACAASPAVHETPRPSTSQPRAVPSPPQSMSIVGQANHALFGPDTSRGDMDERVVTITDDRPSGFLDAHTMVAAGLGFQFAKATRGHVDTEQYPCAEPNFKESRSRADDAGLLFGGYHFLNAGNGTEQADAFSERLEATGGQKGIMHAVDFEPYAGETGMPDIVPSYDDLMEFIERHQQNSDKHPLVVYTDTKTWNNLAATNNHIVPPMPENTYLWWVRLMRTATKDQIEGPISLLDKKVSRPQDPEDPWRSEGFGREAPRAKDAEDPLYPFFRQITFRGHLQQFDGSDRKVIYNPEAYNKRVLDMNVSFRPYSQLLALAGLAPGALPEPISARS